MLRHRAAVTTPKQRGSRWWMMATSDSSTSFLPPSSVPLSLSVFLPVRTSLSFIDRRISTGLQLSPTLARLGMRTGAQGGEHESCAGQDKPEFRSRSKKSDWRLLRHVGAVTTMLWCVRNNNNNKEWRLCFCKDFLLW